MVLQAWSQIEFFSKKTFAEKIVTACKTRKKFNIKLVSVCFSKDCLQANYSASLNGRPNEIEYDKSEELRMKVILFNFKINKAHLFAFMYGNRLIFKLIDIIRINTLILLSVFFSLTSVLFW